MTKFNLAETLSKAGWTEDSITLIYHGGDHVCRCGCAGKYFEPGSVGFKRAMNALRRGFITEEKGDTVFVTGYGHNEMQVSDGVELGGNYINIPIAADAQHNKCYCLYNN